MSDQNRPHLPPRTGRDRPADANVAPGSVAFAVVPGSRLTFDDAGGDDPGPIVVSGLLVPWNTTVQMNWWGDTVEFAPGSVMPAAGAEGRVKFLLDHRSHGMGYGLQFASHDDGLWGRFAIPRDELGDVDTARAVRQMRNGIRDALSIGVELRTFEESDGPDKRSSHFRVTEGFLFETSSVLLPRFDDARVESIAAHRPTSPRRATRMSDTPDPDVPETPDPDDPDDAGDELEARRLAQHLAATRHPTRRPGPVRQRSQYSTLGEWVHAVAGGREGAMDSDDRRRIGFALTDILTSDIAGLLPPTWVSDFAEELNAARPFVTAFDTRPLPESGMVVTWPKKTITGPLVAAQATQKTEIESGKVAVTAETSNIVTYAGGNDVSIQTILRSDPSYLSILFEEYGYALAEVHNTAVGAAALTAITGGNELPLSDDVTAITGTLAEAAKVIFAARRGARPNRLVMGLNIWELFAGAADAEGRPLFPAMSGLNPVGQISINTPEGEVRGINFVVDPVLDPDEAVLGWNRAITTWLGPVQTMSADVPALLGRDVAIFQFATSAIRRPDALVQLTLTPETP